MDYEILGKRIEFLRCRRGMSAEMLAEKMGCPAEFVAGIEAGREQLSLDMFCNLINALGCSADKILNPQFQDVTMLMR